MLYLTCTTITSVDLAHYGVSRVKDWVSVDCGTKIFIDDISQMNHCYVHVYKCSVPKAYIVNYIL